MSTATFAVLWNWLLRRRDVPPIAKLLYARLAQFQRKNHVAWPSVNTLADELGTTRATIIHNVTKLEDLGLLKVQRRTGYRASNRYSLNETTGVETSPVKKSDQSTNLTSLVKKLDLTSIETRPEYIKNRSGKKSNNIPVEIPTSLNVPEFLTAWKDYQQHRIEIKSKLTSITARKQLAALETMGVQRAVAAINHSLSMGWKNIFEKSKENHAASRNGRHQTGAVNATNPGKYANVGTTLES